MRAIRYHEYGGPEVLVLDEVPPPQPGDGELLVGVRTAGVTWPVVRQTRGGAQPLPAAPSGEVAGTVVALGGEVDGFTVGQRVVGLAFDGAYAEQAVLRGALAAAIPDTMSDADAIALARGGQVALGVLDAARFTEGQSVLVTAAAGGVGHLAVQLATALGASRVIGAVGSAGKTEFVLAQGADEVLSYDQLPGAGADIVLDGVGGDLLALGVAALAPFGRLVSYSATAGQLDVATLMGDVRTVTGFSMAQVARTPGLFERRRAELWRLHAEGHLHPATHATFPLADASRAHALLEARANHGKVLLHVP